MSENEKNPREGENDSPDEGVALSPYDSDLRSPEGEPETGEFEFPTPAGYDEPETGGSPEEAVGSPEGPPSEQEAVAPGFETPEWASFESAAPPSPEGHPEHVGASPVADPDATQVTPVADPDETQVAPVPYSDETQVAPVPQPEVDAEGAPSSPSEADEWAAAFESAQAGDGTRTPFEERDHEAPVEAPAGTTGDAEDATVVAAPVDVPSGEAEYVPAPPPPATWSPEGVVTSPVDSPDVVRDESASETDATQALPAGTIAAAGAAAAGAAAGAAVSEPDPLSDTAVRRTSLLRPERPELPSNEPTALRESTEADPRVANYGTAYHPEDDALFEGAVYDKVPSRVGAHLWGTLAMILLIPVAWYLIADAGARMVLPENAQWTTGTMTIAVMVELLAGIIVMIAALLFARASSVGAFVTGGLITVVGGVFVVVPGIARDLLTPAQEWLRSLHAGLGGNIAHHLEADGSTGRLLIIGVALLMVGVISHSARRRGRDEQRIRAAVERRQARLGG